MDYLARSHRRSAAGTGSPSASRWTITGSRAAAFLSLQKHLPNARFVDATALVNWQRAIKSPQEIDYMRKAARIVEAMHGRIVEKVEPGMRKNDLVAEIYNTGILGVDGHRRRLSGHRAAAALRRRRLARRT